MKKFLAILVFTLGLTGCSDKSDYGQLQSDLKGLQKSDALKITLNSTFQDTDSDLDGTDYQMDYIVDSKKDIIKVDIDDSIIYICNDSIYINMLDQWFAASYTLDEHLLVSRIVSIATTITNLPHGSTALGKTPTGNPEIDNVIGGKTLDSLFVDDGDGKYTIAGLDDALTFTTGDNLVIEYTVDDKVMYKITIDQAKHLTAPAELDSALSLDSVANSLMQTPSEA